MREKFAEMEKSTFTYNWKRRGVRKRKESIFEGKMAENF